MTSSKEEIKPGTDNNASPDDQTNVSMEAVDRFVQSFEKSARRWEIIVYPAMFAFIVLAGYGFFLIYNLTSDIRYMARAMDPSMGEHMETMAVSIQELNKSMLKVSNNMVHVSEQMNELKPMRVHISNMDRSMSKMDGYIGNMDRSMLTMSAATTRMQMDMGRMTHNVSKPMSMMNSFMPW